VDDPATVELQTTVSPAVRDHPFRCERYLKHQRRRLAALIPDDRHLVGDQAFAVVEYPAEPGRPGEKVYCFVLHHAA
jgi:hypothetical protein